jgi:dTDP-4-amino-4,6-dideoxygalactose transaminase
VAPVTSGSGRCTSWIARAGPETMPFERLALLGGRPRFASPLHVGCPNIGSREEFHRRVDEAFDRRWLTNDGQFVSELERRLAQRLGVRHCICICNGTIALELAVRALGLTGEVLLPSFTFVATAHALRWMGLTPVFCDIESGTHTLDPASVESRITPRTTGVLGVHLWGHACAVEALADLAAARNLTLLFDAAHAFDCRHRGRPIGSFGHAEIFSFHATKFFHTLEGGAVTTNDDELAAALRLSRNFGFSGLDRVDGLGTNGKMNEVSAAMGLTNLDSADAFVTVNRRNYLAYRRGLSGIPGFRLMEYDHETHNNYQYVVIEVDGDVTGLSRDDLLRVLFAENVLARRYFWPGCHRMEPYRSGDPEAGRLLPETERVADRVLVLPTGTAVGEDDVATVCDIIRVALASAKEVSGRRS